MLGSCESHLPSMAEFASVCILSFNRPRLLRQAISTAIKNAEYPLELIVHDDGSDEETVEVLREFHRNGLISLLMLNPPGHNEGQGIALNRMFAAAKGDPIVKMDHDMELEPGWLKQCADLLRLNEVCNREYGDEHPRIGALGLFKYEYDPVDYRKMLIGTRAAGSMKFEIHRDFVGSAMVISRDAWEEFGPFEERSPAFAEDAVWKQWVDERPGWCNALFPEDLAVNVGFGLGPSTVNVPGENGAIDTQQIADGPAVIDLG